MSSSCLINAKHGLQEITLKIKYHETSIWTHVPALDAGPQRSRGKQDSYRAIPRQARE